MKKKYGVLVAAALAVCLAIGGCTAPVSEEEGTSSDLAAGNLPIGEETSTPVPELVSELPEPVTGEYNGQTITMQLAFTPTLDWDTLWTYKEITNLRFVNGYAIATTPGSSQQFYIDPHGGYIGGNGEFKLCRFFDENGRAQVKLADGSWAYIDTDGKVIGPSEEPPGRSALDGREEEEGVEVRYFGEPGAYYEQLFDDAGNLLNETKFSQIGYFYHGLALIIQDKKIGLIDREGNIVIPPTIAYDKTVVEGSNWEYDPNFMDEDLVIAPIGGKLAVLEIIRS